MVIHGKGGHRRQPRANLRVGLLRSCNNTSAFVQTCNYCQLKIVSQPASVEPSKLVILRVGFQVDLLPPGAACKFKVKACVDRRST